MTVVWVLGWVFQLTVLGWIVAEIVLQVTQWRQGGQAQTTEWRSLGVIVLSILVGNILAVLLRDHLPSLNTHLPGLLVLGITLPVMWLGIGFRLWSIRTLGRYFRGVVHVQQDHQVVRDGPYRVLRHPSYSGALLAVAGVCLVFNNILSMVVFVLCAFLGIYYRITVEERVLAKALGAAYTDYAAQTKRLVPGVW